jgi:hypothetical protein
MPTKGKIKSKYPKLKEIWKKVDGRGNYQKPNQRLFNAANCLNALKRQKGLNALDIGCNNGILSVVASDKFDSVVGIDTDRDNKNVILKAKKTADFFGKDNCKFYEMSFLNYIEKGKWKEHKINSFLGFQVLYHLNDKEISVLKKLLPDIKMCVISIRPEVGDRIEPGKPANKLGLYTIDQVKDFFSPYFSKFEMYNEKTRWPTLIIQK